MATLVLSTVGAAVGGSVGGTLAGLSSVAVGRAVGATFGRVLDQRIMGHGSQSVETGRVDRFRLTQTGEGQPIAQVYGRMRVAGQVIWASDFLETSTTTGGGGGKGAPSQPRTTRYSYSVSLALAVCDGVIARIGRVWADGEEVALSDLNMRVYTGTEDQLPDPLMEAVEGAGNVPAYRGTAYVVFEDLNLEPFGNRVPQFSFEISRPEQPGVDESLDLTRGIRGVALMPGTGEYALATTPVYYSDGPNSRWSANVHTPSGKTDFSVALEALEQELPNATSASLIVSWFGNDLRCGQCRVRPRPEKPGIEGENMPWQVSGISRSQAEPMDQVDGEPIYGGTPTDASVVEAIVAMRAAGRQVIFYPFILMDQLDGNTLPNPYGGQGQAHLPWRGRITLDLAPGQPGSADGTAAATGQVAQFFGTARASDFSIANGQVSYSGPDEWSFSRFILHYAALCAAAGGVEGFCIGSELRGLTQIRDDQGFPFVDHLIQLTTDVRALVGDSCMIGYAADWTEYFGYQPQDGSGDRLFHLDPLWAHPDIDFVGIDNYMPLSDWRDEAGHLDEDWGAIYDLDYLKAGIEGGEGYDWYYHSDEARAAQIRTPIEDGAYNEPWVWRYKDIRGWWENEHHERIGGVRQANPTGWEPKSKPIWFTEYGCAAVDKGSNQPNKFLDQKSSESSLPRHSNGARDDLMQMQYLRAMNSYWADVANNPVSDIYGGPMIDMARALVWAWDARPYPFFPNNRTQWSDGENYARGHWISGRTSSRPLASVVHEICARAGLTAIDTKGLYGSVRGYTVDQVETGRAALQPLMLRYGFDAVERDGVLRFIMRDGHHAVALVPELLARAEDLDGLTEQDRAGEVEMSGRVRVGFVQADGDYDVLSEEAVLPDDATHAIAATDFALSMTRSEGRQVAERWLAEARVSRDALRLALPPSRFDIGAGDVIELPAEADGAPEGLYRIDRVEQGPYQILDAVRIEPSVYEPSELADEAVALKPFVPPVPVTPLFLDLPLITGDEIPHAPYIAATANPWPGSVAVYNSSIDADYVLNSIIAARSIVGVTKNNMDRGPVGLWDRSTPLEVELTSGTLSSAADQAILSGSNLAAIGDGSTGQWELFQFADAELIAPQTYWLSKRLRGQLGSDGLMPDSWPAGSWFVLLNGIPEQISLPQNLRQVAQFFRIGPARRGYDDPSYVMSNHAFDGNGLRPYAPGHLRGGRDASGNLALSWVRRTRIDGDGWEGEVPLGEDFEAYRVRIEDGSTVLREVEVGSPVWTYPTALQMQDGVTGAVTVSVSQISARYGAGLPVRRDFDL